MDWATMRQKKIQFWESIVVAVPLFGYHYEASLQNAADIIITCDNHFIATKFKKSLLQIAFGFLLQNGTVITTCVGKKCHVHFEWYYHAFPLPKKRIS